MKLIKRHYEEGYHSNPLYREKNNSQRNQERLRVLLEHKAGGRLLEVGCGTGGFLRLAERSFAVECYEVSHTAADAMRPHFGSRVNIFNIEQQTMPRTSYDVIAAYNILEHLQQPVEVVNKLYQALTSNGLMIGSVPHNYGLVGGLNTRLGNFFDRTHVSTFPPDTWKRIFQHAGFKTIDFFGELTIGRNRCRYLKGPLWPYFSFNLMFLCKK